MERFQAALKTTWEGIFSGTDAEQALVRYAGITTPQRHATFLPVATSGIATSGLTRFTLDLTSVDVQQFLSHYEAYHPGLVQAHSVLSEQRAAFDLDTNMLAREVLPRLRRGA